MKATSNESRLGRFSSLLKGGAKPRRHHALMIALVLVALLSFAGVVSADNYYKGTPPKNILSGSVNGSVDVQFADTWNKTPIYDWSHQETWGNFTLDMPPGATLKFAELVVVPYCGSMTADYYCNMTVKLYNNNVYNTTLVDSQQLNLKYVNSTGANYTAVSLPLVNLSRTTSDYIADFDITNKLTGWSGTNVNIQLISYNLTGKCDGRFKEAKLVYGWDVPAESSTGITYYWKNLGNDPITKYIGTYTANKTVFSDVTVPRTYEANLWVDFVAGNSTSGPGYGKYWWNGIDDFSPGTGTYLPVYWTGSKYAGINHWTWNETSGVTVNEGDNVLAYSRTNDYYKIIFALFTIKEPSS